MEAMINRAQFEALQAYFDDENPHESWPWETEHEMKIEVNHGQLVVNDAWLHTDGEWATFPQPTTPR